MTITITRSGMATITPTMVVGGYTSQRTVRNVVHTILGRNDPEVTLRSASLASGTLALMFLTQTAAVACEIAHTNTGGPLHLVDTLVSAANMDYVVASGSVETRLDGPTGKWIVTIPFQEVLV